MGIHIEELDAAHTFVEYGVATEDDEPYGMTPGEPAFVLSQDDAVWIKGTPAELRNLLLRGLAALAAASERPAYRFATAEELREDVDLIHGPETAAIVVDMHHEKHGDYAAVLAVVHIDDAKWIRNAMNPTAGPTHEPAAGTLATTETDSEDDPHEPTDLLSSLRRELARRPASIRRVRELFSALDTHMSNDGLAPDQWEPDRIPRS